MSAGDSAQLFANVYSDESVYNKKVTLECNKPEYLVDGINSQNRFQLKSDVSVGTELIFTATSAEDSSKKATAKVTVVKKAELQSIKIEAPEEFAEKEENGKRVIEVPIGTTSVQLTAKVESTGNYQWYPQWTASWTSYGDGETEYDWLINVDESTGKLTIDDSVKEGYYADITLKPTSGGTISDKVTIRIVGKKNTGTLNGISINPLDGYTIENGTIEVYPDRKVRLNGVPDKTEDYVWTPKWEAGPTFDSTGKQKAIKSISVNEATGEVAVASFAGDGDVAEITLTQSGDTSGIKATIKIKVKYWNVTVATKPDSLNDSKESVTPTRAKKDGTVRFTSTYRGATDSTGQKYIFDHWETDDQNKDLTNYNRGGFVNDATVGDAFKMPERDVHLTAVFAKSWDVKEKIIGGNNIAHLLSGATDYSEGATVETYIYKSQLEGRHLVLKNVKVVKANGEEIPFQKREETAVNNPTLNISFTMPAEEVTVELTLERDTDIDKKLTLGDVTGMLVSGTAGTASAEVTVSGYDDGVVLTVGESYSEGTLKDEGDRTAGLSFTVSSVTGGKAQVTIQTDQTVPAGTYSFAVVASDEKAKATGKVTVQEAEAKSLTVKGASIELEEDATGELNLKGTSLNLQNGTAVKAIETDAKGTEKTFGKTEGLVFDDTTIADNGFTMKAHLSKTVAAGTYYFKVQAGDTVSEVASIVVTRTKKEEPEPTPPVEEKEYSINASCNSNQGSIEIRVNGTEATKAKKGDKVILTAIPKSGYKLKNWSLNMDMTTITPSEGTLTDTTISFLMPEGTVTVGAAFESTATENPDTPTSVAPTITAFVVANVNGVIDQSTGQITVVVPNGTDVTALKPAVAVSDGATVTPSSGATVNFTDAVVYTVKSASGETKQYVVTVKVQEASVSDSLWDQITNPEGDRSWWKKADSIKSHKKNKYPKYW